MLPVAGLVASLGSFLFTLALWEKKKKGYNITVHKISIKKHSLASYKKKYWRHVEILIMKSFIKIFTV
jgi:hypothetical protein